VTTSLLLALFLNMLPLGRVPGFPDWVALVLAFWCVREPLKIGMGTAFLLGFAMDVANAMSSDSIRWRMSCWLTQPPACRDASSGFPCCNRRCIFFRCCSPRNWCGGDADAHRRRVPRRAVLSRQRQRRAALVALTYLLLLPQYQPLEKDMNRPI